MNVGLKYEDLQPQFSIINPTAECDRNGDYYDSAGNKRGKACPISGALIRKSGPRLTRHTLLDESPSIKMSDGYCYDKKAFIEYLISQIRKQIHRGNHENIRLNDIKSPSINVPYDVAELIEFQNAGLINFKNEFDSYLEQYKTNEYCFYSLIQPEFYYSFNNIDNNNDNYTGDDITKCWAQNLFYLFNANQYLQTLGATDPIGYIKRLIIMNYLDMFNTVPRDNIMLDKIYEAGTSIIFMPFIRLYKTKDYYMNITNTIEYGRDFELIWDNHPFFERRFRRIIEGITNSCWQPTIFSGEMSLRRGTRIEHHTLLCPHGNIDISTVTKWINLLKQLLAEKRENDSMIGGKRRPKNYHKTKRINKRRNKKTRGHRKN
jgi:hypothetical protein